MSGEIYNNVVRQHVDPRMYGAKGTGDDVGAIQAAHLVSNRLYFSKGTYRIGSPYTTKREVIWEIESGAFILIAPGMNLTIQGEVVAGLYQIFAWTESSYPTGADLAYEPVRIYGGTVVYPEWWGAKGLNPMDKTTADDDALLRACRNYKRVLLSKMYRLTKPLRLEEGTEIEGLGYHATGTGAFGPGFYIDEGFQPGTINKLLFTPGAQTYERVMLEKFNIEVEGTNAKDLVLMHFPGASDMSYIRDINFVLRGTAANLTRIGRVMDVRLGPIEISTINVLYPLTSKGEVVIKDDFPVYIECANGATIYNWNYYLAGVKQASGGPLAWGSLYFFGGTYLTASNIQYETCPNPVLSPAGRPAVILAGANISLRDSNIFTEFPDSIAIEVDQTSIAQPRHGSVLVENIRLTRHAIGATGDFKTLVRVKTAAASYVEWNRADLEVPGVSDGGLYLKRWTPSGIDVAGFRTSNNQHYAQQQVQFIGSVAAGGFLYIRHSGFLRALKPDNYSAGSYLITVSARNASNGTPAGALIFVSYACSKGNPVLTSLSVLHGPAIWRAEWDAVVGLVKLTNLTVSPLEEVLIVSHQQDFKSALIG